MTTAEQCLTMAVITAFVIGMGEIGEVRAAKLGIVALLVFTGYLMVH